MNTVMRNLWKELLVICVLMPFQPAFSADKGTSKMQLLRVKNMMAAGDFIAAFRVLREYEKTDSITSELYYLSGKCDFNLKNYDDAIRRFDKSIRLNELEDLEKYYYLGRSYQSLGNLQSAISTYREFLAKHPKKSTEAEEAKTFLEQCVRADQMIKNPVAVTITNTGIAVNSEFPEYNPCVSADGQTLIFTSRRPESTGKLVDPEDGKFYEDIYISKRDTLTGSWMEASSASGQLNSEAHDANMSLSPDGKQIFVYRNMGSRGSGELFVSKLSKTGKWSAASRLEGDVNTSYFESSACLSPDGKTLYFVSERPKGGFGMGDIYMARKEGKTGWGKAVNLGPSVNDEHDQIGVFVHPDGKTLYFSSNSPQSLGGYDVFKTTFENGKWSSPENLGYPINTTGDERCFVMSTDGRRAWFSSDREGTQGDYDIWELEFPAPVRKAESGSSVPSGAILSIVSGQIIDSDAIQVIETEITVIEKSSGKESSFSSDENGQYFMTLEGNKDYTLKVNAPGFKPYTYDFFLKTLEAGTFTQEKVIVLDRIKN